MNRQDQDGIRHLLEAHGYDPRWADTADMDPAELRARFAHGEQLDETHLDDRDTDPSPAPKAAKPVNWRRMFVALLIVTTMCVLLLATIQVIVFAALVGAIEETTQAVEGTAHEVERAGESQKVDCGCLDFEPKGM